MIKHVNRQSLPVLGIALACLLLVAIGLSAYRDAREQIETASWVDHTYEIIDELESVLASFAVAESRVRGFALSQGEYFLEEFEPALDEVERSFAAAREGTTDNSDQQRRLALASPKIARRKDQLRARVQELRTGKVSPPPREHEELRDDIEGLINDAIADERELLSMRRTSRDKNARRMALVWSLGLSFSVTLVLGVYVLLRREMRRRQDTEAELNEKHAIVGSILEGTTDAVYLKDLRGTYLMMNSPGARLFGLTPDAIMGKTDAELFASDGSRAITEHDRQVIRSGEPKTFEEDVLLGDESRIFFTTRAPYRDHHQQIAGVIGISRDITERKAQEARRLQESALLLQMTELLQACRTLGEAYEVIGRLAPAFFSQTQGVVAVYNSSRNLVETCASWGDQSLLRNDGVFTPDECWSLRRGQPHHIDDVQVGITCKHVPDLREGATLCLPLLAQGELLGILHLQTKHSFDDESKRRASVVGEQLSMALANLQLRETLRNQSIRDALTGLYNRRYTEETFERELRRAARSGDPLAVLMMDIDHFKRFNDTFGHEAGDGVLREVGKLLETRTRGGDVASRIGGEELVVILPGANAEAARTKAEQLREEVSRLQPMHLGQPIGQVTISIGVAEFPRHGTTSQDLMRAADAALYQAKRAGRNQVVVAE